MKKRRSRKWPAKRKPASTTKSLSDAGVLSVEPAFRSPLERKVAAQLTAAGIEYEFEPRDCVVRYDVPQRKGRYLPDFVIGRTIIETKGWFQTKDRQKIALIKEQFPNLDLRLVFQGDATKKKIYKDSPTTYANWADDHGVPWAHGGCVPDHWIKELKG